MDLEHNQSADYYYGDSEVNGTQDYSQYEMVCVKEEVRSFAGVFLPAFYTVAFVAGVAGNSTVVAVYARHKKRKTHTDVYIMNLAVADLLLLVTLPFWAVSAVRGWVLGVPMCKATSAVFTVNFVSGMQFLACISLDRYGAVAKAPGPRRPCWLVCSAVWLLALLLSAPQLVFHTVNDQRRCLPVFSHFLGTTVQASVQIMEICVGFVVPFLVMAVCYSATARKLVQLPDGKRSRPLRVLLAVVAVFVVTQLPYNIVKSWQAVDILYAVIVDCETSKRMDVAVQVTKSLALFHSCLNPLLYAFMGSFFKMHITKMVKTYGYWRRQRPSPEDIPFDSEGLTEPTSTFSI